MALSHDTQVYIVALHAGNRYWLVKAENQQDKRLGRLILQGQWSQQAGDARSMSHELAAIYRRRFLEECNQQTRLTLSAGSDQYVEEDGSSPSGEDQRTPMSYRGIIATPGVNTKTGARCWYVRMHENGMQLESFRGDSPAEAIDKVFEHGKQHQAEKVPVSQAPQQQQAAPVRPAGPRLRPGSFR